MVPSNGDLFVRQVGHHDAGSTFRCQTHHRLSKETRLSTSAGRLFVTDPQGNVPPRILDPLATLRVKAGENVVLPCPAQGYPQPTLIWYIKDVTGHLIPVPSSGRHSFHREVLAIRDAQAADSAMYVCVASNIIGAAKAETALTVIGEAL
uniref:Ig-like domain-containing protein n=1 Tax=Strigamia maritima TaxID=126957 RepID=T1JKH3_STRMM